MKTVFAVALTSVLFIGLAVPGEAQLHFGAQASWAFDRFDESPVGVGPKVALGIPVLPLEAQGSFDYFFPACSEEADCSLWTLNGSIVLRIPLVGAPLKPFVGVGITYQSLSVDDADIDGTGSAIIAGVELGATPVIRPFIEGKYEFVGEEGTGIAQLDDHFVFTAGIIF